MQSSNVTRANNLNVARDEIYPIAALYLLKQEHWVQCGTCEIWVHHACGLFNKLLNGDFECPRCILKDRAA